MKCLNATAVCLAVLYGIDAIGFDGWYFAAVHRVLIEVCWHWL